MPAPYTCSGPDRHHEARSLGHVLGHILERELEGLEGQQRALQPGRADLDPEELEDV